MGDPRWSAGPPSVLFEYDPSRAGSVPVRLLEGFSGILQADGYSGYSQVCKRRPDTDWLLGSCSAQIHRSDPSRTDR